MFREEGGLLMAFRGGIYCWRGCKRLFGVISSKSRLLSPTKAQQTDVKWQLLFFLKSLTSDVENDFGHWAGLFLWVVNLPAWIFRSSVSRSQFWSQMTEKAERRWNLICFSTSVEWLIWIWHSEIINRDNSHLCAESAAAVIKRSKVAASQKNIE